MTKLVKVCGMKEPGNIREVEALGIDLMGFIFYARSPRFVGEKAPSYLPSACRRVGVFVNSDIGYIAEKVERFGLDFAQLHGSESPEFCRELAATVPGLGIIKAFSIDSCEVLDKTGEYEGAVSFFLFDTPTAGFGGSGECFDWSVLKTYKGHTPFLLSGGIGPDSTAALAGFNHPRCCGIDLNSRFEAEPGVKDAGSLATFISDFKKDQQYE